MKYLPFEQPNLRLISKSQSFEKIQTTPEYALVNATEKEQRLGS